MGDNFGYSHSFLFACLPNEGCTHSADPDCNDAAIDETPLRHHLLFTYILSKKKGGMSATELTD